jgi:hypothetical protein
VSIAIDSDPLHAGMPRINRGEPPLAYFEFWPPGLIYFPCFVFWALQSIRYGSLTLPTVANPGIPAGGLCGESKTELLDAAGPLARRYIAPFIVVEKSAGADALLETKQAALDSMHAAGLGFPVVGKPDIGCRGAGVRALRTEAALIDYIGLFPERTKFLLQKMIDVEGEAGVFYVRHPDEEKGRIPSLTLKYFPYLTGDGRRTLEQLIRDDARAGRIAHIFLKRHAARVHDVLPAGERFRLVFSGNHARGTIFRDGTPLVTEALRAGIDEIAKDINGFYFGRFDIRFADFQDLLAGRNFSILEFNGAGAEQTHMWDSQHKLVDAYRIMFDQYGTLFEIAAANRRRGAKPTSIAELVRRFMLEQRLTRLYPSTE